jgi:hypothetical protein
VRTQQPPRRLQLGPIVGHTDDSSSRIWIRSFDVPQSYTLRVAGHGTFPFVCTSSEFCTAVALAHDLRPDWIYRYEVLRAGRLVIGSAGTFRTMPAMGSMSETSFVVCSCSSQTDIGLWERLAAHIEQARPRFLLAIGDQVYLDADGREPGVWKAHRDSPPAQRRAAMGDKYQENWDRAPIRRIFANIPTYMMWDDHEIRDGWGSIAPDSPTLAARHPGSAWISQIYSAYFEDARDLYWHFQQTHNPPALGHLVEPPASGRRQSLPYFFVCARIGVLMVDARGERDPWRPDETPILGSEQWRFIDDTLAALPAEIDLIVIVTPGPIVATSPTGGQQHLVGHRDDDVALFRKRDLEGLRALEDTSGDKIDIVSAAAGAWLRTNFGYPARWRNFRLSDIDDARDQWCNVFSRPEQERLIRAAAAAQFTNRAAHAPRVVLFAGGDLHVGGIFDLELGSPRLETQCMVASGIGKRPDRDDRKWVLGAVMDDHFEVASGIRARLRGAVTDFNFGAVSVIPMAGGTPRVQPTLVHQGAAWAGGLDATLLPILGPYAISTSGR